MIALLNLAMICLIICFLFFVLYLFYKTRKKNSYLLLKEIELEKRGSELLELERQINLNKISLEEQKNLKDKQWDDIKIAQEILEEKSRKIKESKYFLEEEGKKLQTKIEYAKEKFREVIQKIFQKSQDVEKMKNVLEEERKKIEIEKHVLESLKQKINEEKKEIPTEWQKIKVEREEFIRQKIYLNEKDQELHRKEQQLIEDRNFIDEKNEKIRSDWQQVELERQEFERQKAELVENAKRFEEKEKEFKKEKEEFEREKQNQHKVGTKNEKKSIIKRPPKRLNSDHHKGSSIPTDRTRIIPELICWEKGRCWYIGIHITQPIPEDYYLQIMQDGEVLVQDDNHESYWVLKSISSVKITWREGNEKKCNNINIFENEESFPLIFKSIGKNEKFGKYVRNPSSGAFCAIVPEDWKRDNENSEPASVEPESFFLPGYKVHFFYLRYYSGFSIAFIRPDDRKISMGIEDTRFTLIGNQLPDTNDEMGPLFGDELPKIKDNLTWNDIETIIIGEEGEGVGEHRWEILPDNSSNQIDLNQLEKKGKIKLCISDKSWFFIRFYDTNYKLVESLDFRYIQGLRSIVISNPSFLPLPSGHQPVIITFSHDKFCKINLIKNDDNRVNVKHFDEKTFATIPPDAAWDLTDWRIEDGNGKQVNVELVVERIWWNLFNVKDPLSQTDWTDKILNISRDFFSPTSPYAISLQFPKPKWFKNVKVGFDEIKIRQYEVLSYQRSVNIMLRDFCECEEILKSIDQAKLIVWFDKDWLQKKVLIAKIESVLVPPSKPPPEPPIPIDLDKKPCCNTCDHARRKYNSSWCRRANWLQQNSFENFVEKIAHFKCGEWRGEYQDENGNWISK